MPIFCDNLDFVTLLKEGKPAEVILKTIEENSADQVIISKSGKSGIERFFKGSISETVLKNANVPVLII